MPKEAGDNPIERVEEPFTTEAEAVIAVERGEPTPSSLKPGERLLGGLEYVEDSRSPEIDPYQTEAYLKLLHGYTSEALTYDLREGFRRLRGAILSEDAKDFSKSTTRLAEEKGEKLAGEEVGLLMEEADAKLLGIAGLYGGLLLTAEGDGRRLFFPSLPGEDPAEAVKRATFVAEQFQESAKGLHPLKFRDGDQDVEFRVGVDCTDRETGDLVVTSLGDEYLRTVAVFGKVIPRVDYLQREADAHRHQVAVSPAARALLTKSRFRSTESGKNFILSSLHSEDKPEPVTINLRADEGQVPIVELTHYYEAHIPQDRRSEMRDTIITTFEEGRPVEFKPFWDYPRVSTSFIKVSGLRPMIGQSGDSETDAEAHRQINPVISQVLHIVDHNGGRVERITGDGVIYAVFEGPSNEYHATRATFEAGQKLNGAGFDFRAGVSTDYAFSGVAGTEGHHTFTQVGKRVNESSRLMQTAPENRVVISGSTHRRASHRLRCKELGEPIELKGVGTVDRYVVEKIDYRAGRYAEVEKIVGREADQRELEKHIATAAETGQSQVVVVEGEPGVGKTAVVSKTIADSLEAGKIYKIDVRSDEANRKLPLSTARQFVRQLLDVPDEVENPQDLETLILSRELPPEMVERLSLLNAVLGTSFTPTDRVKWLDRADQRHESIALMRDLFQFKRQQVSHETPVVCVDDWQFVDRQSADLLADFIRATEGDGIAWLVPTRPYINDIEKSIIEGLKRNLPEEQTHLVEISPFPSFVPPEFPGEEASDAAKRNYYLKLRSAQIAWMQQNKGWVMPLVSAIFDIDPSEFERNPLAAAKVISKVFSKDVSHGNPFYAREILSHLAMSHDLGVSVFVQHPETGKWHFGDYLLPGETKDSVRASRKYYLEDEKQRDVLERVGTINDIEQQKFEALDSNSQAVARVMSCLGLEASKAMLMRLTRMPERRLDMCLDQLMDHGMISDLDGGYFAFVHRITQETIYTRIAKIEEKYAIHETVLGILEAEYPSEQDRLESKFFHAKNSGNLINILKYADLYGRQLRNYGEESGAISVLERGAQAFGELERQGFPGMTEQQKLQTVNEQLERLLFIRFIWNRLAKRGEEVSTLELAHKLFHCYYGGEDGRESHPVEWAAYHAWILSDLGLRVGDKEPERAAREYYEVALDILKPFEQEGTLDNLPNNLRQVIIINLSNTYLRLGSYYRRMDGVDNLTRARELVKQSVHYARMTGNYEAITSAVNGLGIMYKRLGEFELANQCYGECLELAERTGNLPDQALYLNNQAGVLHGLGDSAGVEIALTRSLDITARVFRPQTRAWSNVGLGSLRMAMGDFTSAVEYLQNAKEFFANADVLMSASLSIDLAHCYLRAEQPDTLAARIELSNVQSDDKRLSILSAYTMAYADYLDKYIDFEDFVTQVKTQAEALSVMGMTQSAMDAYRFLGEVISAIDVVRSHAYLERALELSENCCAGIDKKMIVAQLQS